MGVECATRCRAGRVVWIEQYSAESRQCEGERGFISKVGRAIPVHRKGLNATVRS